MNQLQFMTAYMLACDSGGHKYDMGDLLWAWSNYRKEPERYEYLSEFEKRASTLITEDCVCCS
jgi:hypothetical protein